MAYDPLKGSTTHRTLFTCRTCKTTVQVMTRRTYNIEKDRLGWERRTLRAETVLDAAGNDTGRPLGPRQCCGSTMKSGTVKGSYSAARECDARCLGATGPNCECNCSGANHGSSHAVV